MSVQKDFCDRSPSKLRPSSASPESLKNGTETNNEFTTETLEDYSNPNWVYNLSLSHALHSHYFIRSTSHKWAVKSCFYKVELQLAILDSYFPNRKCDTKKHKVTFKKLFQMFRQACNVPMCIILCFALSCVDFCKCKSCEASGMLHYRSYFDYHVLSTWLYILLRFVPVVCK